MDLTIHQVSKVIVEKPTKKEGVNWQCINILFLNRSGKEETFKLTLFPAPYAVGKLIKISK